MISFTWSPKNDFWAYGTCSLRDSFNQSFCPSLLDIGSLSSCPLTIKEKTSLTSGLVGKFFFGFQNFGEWFARMTFSPNFHQDSNRIFTKIMVSRIFVYFREDVCFCETSLLKCWDQIFWPKKSSRLYSNLMPISLYFTMEVCNAAQARAVCRWKHDLNWVFNQLGRLISLRMTWRCMTRPWFNYILYSFFMFCRWCFNV